MAVKTELYICVSGMDGAENIPTLLSLRERERERERKERKRERDWQAHRQTDTGSMLKRDIGKPINYSCLMSAFPLTITWHSEWSRPPRPSPHPPAFTTHSRHKYSLPETSSLISSSHIHTRNLWIDIFILDDTSLLEYILLRAYLPESIHYIIQTSAIHGVLTVFECQFFLQYPNTLKRVHSHSSSRATVSFSVIAQPVFILFYFFTLKGYWLREKKLSIKKNSACRQTL